MPWLEQWQDLGDFLAMGGYAAFVWGSLGACAVGMLFEVVALRLRHRAAVRDAAYWKDMA